MSNFLDSPRTMLAFRQAGRTPTFGGQIGSKRTPWCNSLTNLESSIMCRKNDLPDQITQQACWCWPITDKSSLLKQDFILSQRRISLRSHSNFDGGRLRVMNSVSISIPRKVSLMLGPSVFLETTGTSKNAYRASTLCIAENLGLQ